MIETDDRRRFAARIEDARTWLYGEALPFWSTSGRDGDLGFVEHLALGGGQADVAFKRLRVQARQVFVFSEAYVLGYEAGLTAARGGWQFMRDNGWLPAGGWARRLDRRGGMLDETLDLYDQAFALLAIAAWIRASGDDAAQAWAHRTLDVVEARLVSSSGFGWRSHSGPGSALLQNPHMHVLEAMLALHDATGVQRFKSCAELVLDVFHSRLFDRVTGTLGEYFDANWDHARGERGRIVEPGHHYEWVWLLHQAALVIPGAADETERLFAFGERHGTARDSGLVYDEVFADGSLRTGSHRLWATCEALKAHLARFDHGGVIDVARTHQLLDNIFRYFLSHDTPGTWVDQLDARCMPAVDKIPASSLYHVFVAFTELLRLAPRLHSAGAIER